MQPDFSHYSKFESSKFLFGVVSSASNSPNNTKIYKDMNLTLVDTNVFAQIVNCQNTGLQLGYVYLFSLLFTMSFSPTALCRRLSLTGILNTGVVTENIPHYVDTSIINPWINGKHFKFWDVKISIILYVNMLSYISQLPVFSTIINKRWKLAYVKHLLPSHNNSVGIYIF